MAKKKARTNNRAVIYTRFSPRRKAGECVSCETQAEYCTNYCTFHKLEVIGTFDDKAMSGAKAHNRPGLQAALHLAIKRQAMLVVYSLSRLARNTRETLEIVERLEKAKADLSSVSEKLDTTTAMGRFFFRMCAMMAELDREQIAEWTSDAMLHHQRNGRRMSDKPPYGTMRDPHDSTRLITNTYEQKVINRILKLKEAGTGVRAIARQLHDDGFKPRKVKKKDRWVTGKWHHTLVLKIIDRGSPQT